MSDDRRRQLEEIANRGDPEEWLRVMLHEATRANNAEGARDDLLNAIKAFCRDCPTCDGDGWIERPDRMIGESDDPCPTCDAFRTILKRFGVNQLD